jgi:threonine/homoserine/homoserine lactone efflux protein
MNTELLIALSGFAFVSSVTPGPNNLMLMTSGANYGIWRTMPHFFGVVFGFVLMIVLVGLGLVQIFDAYPLSHDILKLCSIGYLS